MTAMPRMTTGPSTCRHRAPPPHLFARAGKEEEENSDDDYTPQFGSVGGEEENDK